MMESQPTLTRRFAAYCFMALLALGLVLKAAYAAPPAAGDPREADSAKAADHSDHHEPSAMEHTMDSDSFHLFTAFPPHHIRLPKIFGFQITKFMVLEVLACLVIIAIYIPVARRIQSGAPPKGAWDNAFEGLLVFIRDNVAKPNLGEHSADHFVPFLWTLFLFILVNNLFGLVPFLGSATASINVTVALALIVFFMLHGAAIKEMGFGHYIGTYWPHFDVPFPLNFVVKPLVFVLELLGALVRNVVLAVRLFANVFAGHMALATILIFIYAAREAHPALWGTVTVSSVLGIVAMSLLEIFVAFLQAFIFTFLTSLFMGMALHPQH